MGVDHKYWWAVVYSAAHAVVAVVHTNKAEHDMFPQNDHHTDNTHVLFAKHYEATGDAVVVADDVIEVDKAGVVYYKINNAAVRLDVLGSWSSTKLSGEREVSSSVVEVFFSPNPFNVSLTQGPAHERINSFKVPKYE